MLSKIQIENNIDWLLEYASYPVRYLTYKNILKNDFAVSQDLMRHIEKSDLARDIFSKQEKDGSWCSSGAWATKQTMRKSGYTPVSPKYVTTAWILPLLGNLGYSIRDERVLRACEYVLTYQWENGFIGEMRPDEPRRNMGGLHNEPCRFSIVLIGLAKVGAVSDVRVKKAFDFLLSRQRDDGGWVSENHSNQQHWTRSCPFSSYHSAYALYCSELSIYEKQLKKAMEFLLDHLSTKKDSEIQRFFYHGHSLIYELLMFSELKVGLDTRVMKSLLTWLLSMHQPGRSCFTYNGKPITKYTFKDDYMDSRVAKYRLFQLIEDDWLTYYATRIFKNITDK